MKHQEKSLMKMGYRIYNQNPLVYAKPIGFHIITFNFEKKEFLNFFGKQSIWNTEIIGEELWNNEQEFLEKIKWFEASTSLNKQIMNELEFLTVKDQIEILL